MSGIAAVRRLAFCLLALGLGGLGPAVAAAVPPALSSGSEEETQHSYAHIGGGNSVGTRLPRSSDPDRRRSISGRSYGRHANPSGGRDRIAAESLRTLQVRIQV